MAENDSSTEKVIQILANLIQKTLEMEERLKEILASEKNSEQKESEE